MEIWMVESLTLNQRCLDQLWLTPFPDGDGRSCSGDGDRSSPPSHPPAEDQGPAAAVGPGGPEVPADGELPRLPPPARPSAPPEQPADP